MQSKPQIKTLMLFEEHPERILFFELQGDYQHLNGVYINDKSSSIDRQSELYAVVYKSERQVDESVYNLQELTIPTKDWTYFVKCGVILYGV
jgi:ferritin